MSSREARKECGWMTGEEIGNDRFPDRAETDGCGDDLDRARSVLRRGLDQHFEVARADDPHKLWRGRRDALAAGKPIIEPFHERVPRSRYQFRKRCGG